MHDQATVPTTAYLQCYSDAASIPRSSSEAQSCNRAKIPALMAILCQERPTLTRCRGVRRFGGIYSVRDTVAFVLPLLFNFLCGRFNLNLDVRLEYLTLAVANAKSHPISATGRHETAIAFLTDLEEKLDVAQVQLEIYNTLLPHVNDAQEVGDRIKLLSTRLFTMTEVRLALLYFPKYQQAQQLYQGYAIPFDMPALKLLCLYVSEHRDESIVRPIWNQIFDEGTFMHKSSYLLIPLNHRSSALNEGPGATNSTAADRIIHAVVPLGQRFYPSESAFPLRTFI